MKRVFQWSFLIIAAVVFLELLGFSGIWLLSRRYQYSAAIALPPSFLPGENPYFRLRKILMRAPGYYPKYYAAYNLNIGLYPGYSVDGIIEHNEHGYRGAEVNCIKGNKYRILFLGGTNTYGMIKYPDKTFPAQTGKMLNEEIKNRSGSCKEVEIINGGVMDGSSAEELNYYIHKWKYYKPDLVVLHTGGSDEHINFNDENFTPDYTNSRNYEIWQMQEIVPGWMMHSWFVSFLAIALYYHPHDVDTERASAITSVASYPGWFPAELRKRMRDGDQSLNPFFNNINTLVREILSDSVSVLILPNALNPKYVNYFHQEYYDKVAANNKILSDIALKYNLHWVDYTYNSVTPDGWNDYSNLNEEGEKQKAKLISGEIMKILHSPK